MITQTEYDELVKAPKYTILIEMISCDDGIYIYKIGNNKLYCMDSRGKFIQCYEAEYLELDLIDIYDP